MSWIFIFGRKSNSDLHRTSQEPHWLSDLGHASALTMRLKVGARPWLLPEAICAEEGSLRASGVPPVGCSQPCSLLPSDLPFPSSALQCPSSLSYSLLCSFPRSTETYFLQLPGCLLQPDAVELWSWTALSPALALFPTSQIFLFLGQFFHFLIWLLRIG